MRLENRSLVEALCLALAGAVAEEGIEGLKLDRTRPPCRKPLGDDLKAKVLTKTATEKPKILWRNRSGSVCVFASATRWSVKQAASRSASLIVRLVPASRTTPPFDVIAKQSNEPASLPLPALPDQVPSDCTLSASEIISCTDETFVTKPLSLSRNPDALHRWEKFTQGPIFSNSSCVSDNIGRQSHQFSRVAETLECRP